MSSPLDIQSADQVVRHVAILIEAGKLRPGDRLPPERELAQELGVSRPTVRAGPGQAVHGRQSDPRGAPGHGRDAPLEGQPRRAQDADPATFDG